MAGANSQSRIINPMAGSVFFGLAGLLAIVASLFFSDKGRAATGDPGSLAMPLVCGVTLITGALITAWTHRKKRGAICGSAAPAEVMEMPVEKADFSPSLLWFILGLILSVVSFPWLGAVVTFSAGMAFHCHFLDRRSWIFSWVIGVSISFSVCWVFHHGLTIPLPGGILGWPKG